jgi:predicted Rossmann-fold nucleotide-binding protein
MAVEQQTAIPRAARTIDLADEESVKRLLRKSVFELWDIVNNLTRLRPSRPERYRVTVFGSARTAPGHFVDETFQHQTFFTRLHHFVLASDAFVVVPGGVGTALELFMVWQLIQVGHLQNVPLIVAGPGYRELLAWCRRWMLSDDLVLASERDIAIPQCVEGADEAIALLREHHARWLQAQAPGATDER